MISNEKVIKNWWKGEKENLRSTSMFWEHVNDRRVLFSYGRHYPLAKIVDGYVVVNSTKYSVTTSKHSSLVRRAVLPAETLHIPKCGRDVDDFLVAYDLESDESIREDLAYCAALLLDIDLERLWLDSKGRLV